MNKNLWQKMLRNNPGILNEAITSTDDFVKTIEKTIKKYFPKSYVSVGFGGNFEPSVHIRFGVGNKQDWSGGYFENDPVSSRMHIWGFDKEGNMKDKIQLDPSGAGSYVIDPGPDSYMAYDRVKVPVRKKTGSPDQILKSIDKYFSDLKKSLRTNFSKLTPEHQNYVKKYI